MATLLDEILQEINIIGAGACGPSKAHRAGCKCIECGMKKIQPSAKHKSWKERRNERLNKKNGQKQPVKDNRSSAINSEFGWGATANPFKNLTAAANRTETFKVTAKSFIMTIGNNIGNLPSRCDPLAKAKLFAQARFTDSIMSEDPRSDNKNGLYRMYSSVTLRVLHDGNRIISVSPANLYPGTIDTDVGKEISLTPPSLTVDFQYLSRRDNQTFGFGWRTRGRPHLAVEPSFQSVCPRTSRYIWHRMFGEIKLINGSVSIRARVGGSKFPSHRAYVNGRITESVPQGPFSNLWFADPSDSSRVNEISLMEEILNEAGY